MASDEIKGSMTTNISEGGGAAAAGIVAPMNGGPAGGLAGGSGGSEIIDSKPLNSIEASSSLRGEAESNISAGNNNNLSDEKSGNGQPIPNDTNSQQQKQQQQQDSGALEKISQPAKTAELADKNNPPNNSDLLEGRQLAVIDSRQLAVIGPLAKVMPDEGSIGGGTGVSSRTPSVIMADRSHTPNSSMDSSLGLEGRQLTVIDGPSAKGTPDEGSIAGGTLSRIPSVMEDHRGHTPNSSMDSSLGELLGESAAELENGTAADYTASPSESSMCSLDIISTEKPGSSSQNHQHFVKSKSTLDMADRGAAAATLITMGEKPPNVVTSKSAGAAPGEKPPSGLKHSTSSPTENAASAFRRTRSPQPPTINRERTQSSQENEYMNTTEQDDDDDDEENYIPPEIQSKIVEKSPAERYIRFKEKLGSGAYKDVYRAYDTIEGIEVAWNVVRLFGVPKAERIRIVNEVRLLERLHHPNIISFHGSWVNRETERVIFVTEILSSGTLKSFVQKVQLIRWKIFVRWAIQILKGLEYLHSQDPPIIHRDLKCDNIFINGTSGDLRIGDFGLSTAISKTNQPLSVLGTPEFMAPELYDESYNEKVDIYAFGMLLLEIITRDVPYHECTNPAQIYKKVTHGIPPASLRRVRNIDARDFILLCLGIGEDANERPSASDLLKHPFLAKKSADESTIVVEPAVEDMVIDEIPMNSMTFSETGSSEKSSSHGSRKNEKQGVNNKKYASSIDGHEIPFRGSGTSASPKDQQGIKKPPRNDKNAAVPSNNKKSSDSMDKSNGKVEEEESADDHFGEMPENEANMKKVMVLMGRGKTLDDHDKDTPAQELDSISLSSTPPPTSIAAASVKATLLPRSNSEETGSGGSGSSQSKAQYKVSAVPMEDAGAGAASSKPYPNDEINLALTLPDASRTTIEFEFDLVNDDPVQVAREMVTELDEVPDDAVLDISEAISGVARQSRMKQNQWTKMQQQQQHQQMAQQQVLEAQQHQQVQQAQAGMMRANSQGSVIQQAQGIQGPQGTFMMQPPPPPQHLYGSGYSTTPQAGNFQNQHQLATSENDPSQSVMGGGPSSSALQQQAQQQAQSQIPTPQQQQQQQYNHVAQQLPPPPPPSHMSTPQPPSQMSTPHPPPQHQMHVQHQQIPPSPASIPQSASQQFPPTQPQPTMARSNSMEMSSHTELNSNQTAGAQRPPTKPVLQQLQQHLSPGISNSSQDMITPRQLTPPPLVTSQDASAIALQNQNALQGESFSSIISQKQQIQQTPLHSQQPQMIAVPEGSAADVVATSTKQGLIDEIRSEADTEEIRKLEQEFEKKMQRAQKSYGTRMDNLRRSKDEAEAHHQMTLQKHEKERIEFEKRVRLAEEEQMRRLNQMQKEFIEKKKEVRQQHAKVQPPPSTTASIASSVGLQNGDSSRPPLHGGGLLHGGHKRSSSHFDSSLSVTQQPTPITDHKRNSSDSDIHGGTDNNAAASSSQNALLDGGGGPQQQHSQPPPQPPRSGGGGASSLRDRSGSISS